MTRPQPKTPRQLRRFGLILAAVLALWTALLLWRQRPLWPWTAGASALLLLVGLVCPRALGPLERVWMRFAKLLSTAVTYVVLTLAFVLLFTPLGLLLRLLGRRPLPLGFDKAAATYWTPADAGGVHDRPDKPY